MRVTEDTFFPLRGFRTVKCRGYFVRQAFGVEFEQILNVLPPCDSKTTQRPVNFGHVGGEPFPIEFVLSSAVKFCDLSGLTKFFHPTSNGIKWNIGEFFFVERIVEFTVQTATVAHQTEQLLRIVRHGCFIGVVGAELLTRQFGGQRPCAEESLQDTGVNVFDEERTCFHRHQIFKRRHEQRHAQPRWDDHFGVDDSCITGDTCFEEGFETDEVNVAEHDLVLRFPHQQTAVHGSVFL